MLGLSGTVTPNSSGRVYVTINWDISTSSGFIKSVVLKLGTGSAPVNGANATGTSYGSTKLGIGGATNPTSLSFIATGLTIGTTYWIDLFVSADDSNFANGSLSNIDVVAFEL